MSATFDDRNAKDRVILQNAFSRHVLLGPALLLLVGALLIIAGLALLFGDRLGGNGVADVPALFDSVPKVAGRPVLPKPNLMPVSPTSARIINAAFPLVVGGVVAAKTYRFRGKWDSLERARDCLAAAAWYEAGEDAGAQRAVIQTVINRLRHPAFPKSVCAVVFQGSERTTGCQFTFACDGALRRRPSEKTWDRARGRSLAALSGLRDPRVGHATHYHTDWVAPYWSKSLEKIAQIDTHIFYRWPGFWGGPKAFADPGGDLVEPVIEELASLSLAHAESRGLPVLGEGLEPTPVPVASASAALPPQILLRGVDPASLRGSKVRAQIGDTSFVTVDPTSFPGQHAIAALALCKGRKSCTVLGWSDPAALALSTPLSARQTGALTFYYRRDAGGTEQALWNCAQAPRQNRAQCLPEAARDVASLLARQ